MSQPYYSTPANFFVPTNSDAMDPSDLSGKEVGACAGCTMEDYLRGTLDLHGSGILATLSVEFFGNDYATAAAEFDLTSIGQTVE